MQNYNRNKIPRRAFLQGSAAAVGGVMIAGLPASASAQVAGNDTLKVALIGCGGRGTGAASQALSTKGSVELVAMADVFRDMLDTSYSNLMKMPAIASQVKVPEENKFVGFDAYKNAIDLADVVILATPPGFRPEHFEYSVQKGKHVFMEKPVAVDPPGIRKILATAEIAKQKQLNVIVGLQRRYAHTYTKGTVEKLQSGIIGDIVAAQAYWSIGAIRMPERKSGQNELEYQMRNWYHFPWLSGDHIEDTHIHNLDIINWVKQGYPLKAQGMGGREIPYPAKGKGMIFDHHYVEFQYPDGMLLNSQARQLTGTYVKLGEYFIGTKGTADTNMNQAMIKDHAGNTLHMHRDRDDPKPQQMEHDIFFAAIRNGDYINTAEYGAKSTMTAILGRMATYSGEVIEWDKAIKADYYLRDYEIKNWDSEAPVQPDENGDYPIAKPGTTKVL